MCVQVAPSSAQNVPVSITSFTVTSATLYYGQNQTYGADVTSSPLIPGPFLWQNGTQTIAWLPNLDSATTSSVFNGGIVSTSALCIEMRLFKHCRVVPCHLDFCPS